MMNVDSPHIFDAKNRVVWVGLTDEHLQKLISPAVSMAEQLGDVVVSKQVSFVHKLFTLIHDFASLHEWHERADGSLDKLALNSASAKLFGQVRKQLQFLESFVAGLCTESGEQDLYGALMHTQAPFCMHPFSFDQMQLGPMLRRTRVGAEALLSKLAERWAMTLQLVVDRVKPHLIDWEPYAEQFLLPASKDIVLSVLKNPGYQQLAPFATTILDTLKVGKGFDLFTAELADDGHKTAQAALKLLSITFTLYHIRVAWPQVKGLRNQEAERAKLMQQHIPI